MKKVPSHLILACPLTALVLLGSTPANAESHYVFSTFSLPGLLSPDALVITDRGSVAGAAADLSGSGFGFIYDSGQMTRLYGPAGAQNVVATGLSDTGVAVGTYIDSTSNTKGFIYDHGTYTTLDTGYGRVSISPDGHYVSGSDANGIFFVVDRLTQTTNFLPIAAQAIIAHPGAVTNAGVTVGNYGPGRDRQSFIYDVASQALTTFTVPLATVVSANGINASGQITGYLHTGSNPGFSSFVRTGDNVQILEGPGYADTAAYTINNLGQVAGEFYTADNTFGSFIATPVVDPVNAQRNGVFTFNTAVSADTPLFIDPLVSTGYDYRIGAGDPTFKTVSLPIGIGDNAFSILVGGLSFEVAGNQIFDFTTHGFAGGVSEFKVTGIEMSAGLDSNDPEAFVTRLTFSADGRFTGSQSAILAAAVPEPGTYALLLLGLGGLAVRSMYRALANSDALGEPQSPNEQTAPQPNQRVHR